MAYPAIQTKTGGTNAASTTPSANLPSGISSGDLLIIAFGVKGTGTISWPAGWTQVNQTTDSSGCTMGVARRTADGTEGSSISLTLSASQASSYETWRITGATHASVEATAAFANTTSPDPPACTPAFGSADYLCLVATIGNATGTITAAPSGFSNLVAQGSGSAQYGSADANITGSTENPGTFTANFKAHHTSVTIMIPPGASGPTGTPMHHYRRHHLRAA